MEKRFRAKWIRSTQNEHFENIQKMTSLRLKLANRAATKPRSFVHRTKFTFNEHG